MNFVSPLDSDLRAARGAQRMHGLNSICDQIQNGPVVVGLRCLHRWHLLIEARIQIYFCFRKSIQTNPKTVQISLLMSTGDFSCVSLSQHRSDARYDVAGA